MASATKRQRPRAHAGASEQGKATAQRVIDAARELLMTKGHAQFSVRNVAAQAELHLANVQYYFPTRDDLVRAIVKDIDARYRAAYTQALANAPPDRVARFRAILKFALRDIERLLRRSIPIDAQHTFHSEIARNATGAAARPPPRGGGGGQRDGGRPDNRPRSSGTRHFGGRGR